MYRILAIAIILAAASAQPTPQGTEMARWITAPLHYAEKFHYENGIYYENGTKFEVEDLWNNVPIQRHETIRGDDWGTMYAMVMEIYKTNEEYTCYIAVEDRGANELEDARARVVDFEEWMIGQGFNIREVRREDPFLNGLWTLSHFHVSWEEHDCE